MGFEMAKAWIAIRGDYQMLPGDLNKAKAETEKALAQVQTSLRRFGLIAGAIGAGFLTMGVRSAAAFEQTEIAFNTMLGSAEATKELLADLTTFAAKTPFEMPEITVAARGLVMFGERGERLMETLKILGNAAAGTSSRFGDIAMIFNQIRGVGRLLTQDFRQLATRGVISLQDIADYFGVTTQAAQEMLSKGRVSFEDVRNILKGMSEEGGRFFNLMEKQSKSLSGVWSTLKDDVGILAREIAVPLVKGLKVAVGLIVHILDKHRPLVKMLLGTALAIGVVVAAIKAIAAAQKMAAAWSIVLQALMGPKGWVKIAAGIAVAGAAIAGLNYAMEKSTAASKEVTEKWDDQSAAAKKDAAAIDRAAAATERYRKKQHALAVALEEGRQPVYDLATEYRVLSGQMTETEVALNDYITSLEELGLSWESIYQMAGEWEYFHSKIQKIKEQNALKEALADANDGLRTMREELALATGEMTQADRAALRFSRSLDEKLGKQTTERLTNEFRKLNEQIEIAKLEKELEKQSKKRSFGKVGFAELANRVEESMRRDDPQKKIHEELIRHRRILANIERNSRPEDEVDPEVLM